MAVELPPAQAGARLPFAQEPRPLVGRKLPADVVVAEHRRRVAAGLCEAIARRGYEATRVRDIIEPAGISRRTFYELYPGKAEAFLAAHREALASLADEVDSALAGHDRWPAQVEAGVTATLRWCAATPAPACLLLAEPLTAGPHLGYCHDRLVERFAPGLRRGRRFAAAQLPPQLEEFLLGGIAGVVGARLRAGDAAALPGLAPALAAFAVTPYLGSGRATSWGERSAR